MWSNVKILTDKELSAGDHWQSELKKSLDESDVFFVLLSPNSINSSWLLYEMGAVLALEKPIIPISLNPEIAFRIPLETQNIQYFKMKDLENPKVVNQIIESYGKVA